MDVFSSIQEINRSLKDINRVLSKGMLNIYVKFILGKSRTENFNFLNLKNSSPGQFFGSSNSRRYGIFKLFVITSESRGLGAKVCVDFLLFLF